MDEKAGPTWYFREGGIVTDAVDEAGDPARFHLENALARVVHASGDPGLSEAEAAAVNAFNYGPTPKLSDFRSAAARLAAAETANPTVFRSMDLLADELGAMCEPQHGPRSEAAGWRVLRDYCDMALRVTLEEYGAFESWPGLEALAQVPLEDAARIEAAGEALGFEGYDWVNTPEGKAAIAAIVPDGGPEGWSQEPPANPAHPLSKARRGPSDADSEA